MGSNGLGQDAVVDGFSRPALPTTVDLKIRVTESRTPKFESNVGMLAVSAQKPTGWDLSATGS